jgi:DNA topoisomerase IA
MQREACSVFQSIVKIDPSIQGLVDQVDRATESRAFDDRKITAHHAIIPTGNPSVSIAAMSSNELSVYRFVRRRYLAQFLGEYRFLKSVIQVDVSSTAQRRVFSHRQDPGLSRVEASDTDPYNFACWAQENLGRRGRSSGLGRGRAPGVQTR